MRSLSATPPLPLHGFRYGVLAPAALLLLAYLVTLDQGAVSQSGQYLHELMHDGRHLLGVPCD
ncbi:MAG: CbtB domain-containing protein [Carbonactinosporaceae bacterium]